jgi:membrane protein YqaA with SNARE-associated domain
MMPLSGAEQVVIVVAGAALTLLLGAAVLYWIDREWRELDAQHRRGSDTSERREVENQAGRPPTDPPSAS